MKRLLTFLACALLLTVAMPLRAQFDSPGVAGFDARRSARLHTELATRYFLAGENGFALDELRIALAVDGDYAMAYSVRGLVYARLKELDKAEVDFQKALRLAPEDPEINNNYGWYLCDTGHARRSLTFFFQALKNPLYQTPERAYTNAGACAMKADDPVGAEQYLQQALRLATDGAPMARFHLAHLNYRRGQWDDARRYLGESLKQMEPPTAEALWLGIRLERRLGNRMNEGSYAAQLRGRYPDSPEYQAFLQGKFND